jgi:transposase
MEEDIVNLSNPQGHQYSRDQNQLLLRILHGLMVEEDMSEDKACKYLERISGANHMTLLSLLSEWKSTRSVPSSDTSKMGSGNPSHPRYLQEWNIEIEQQIHHKIEQYNQSKGFCNTADIQSFLDTELHIQITRNGLCRRLHALGYRWGKSRTMGGMSVGARIARGVTYMKELALALGEEKTGDAVICYTDESYVNVRHKIQYTWYSPYSPITNEVGGPTGKGEREIIIHAITKHGVLGGDCSNHVDLSKSLPAGQESSQHFFVGGYIGEDYHKNMDDQMYINWMRNRFIPAFSAKFPGKKCILVLDNAGYHHAAGKKFMKLGGTKQQLIVKLETLGVESIMVERKGMKVEFRQSTWEGLGGSSSPTVKELNDALKVELPKHKEFQTTEVQRMFDELGWQLIYTPPYTPETQPIEKVWAYVKHIVASHFTPLRTASTLHVDLIMAFYGGDPLSPPGVTAEFCQSVIKHSLQWCNQFISRHVYPGGNLSSLAQWVHEHPEQEAVTDENQDIVDGLIQEEEEVQYDIFEFHGGYE